VTPRPRIRGRGLKGERPRARGRPGAGNALVGSSGPGALDPRLLRTRVAGSTDLHPRPLDYQGNPEALTAPRYECYSASATRAGEDPLGTRGVDPARDLARARAGGRARVRPVRFPAGPRPTLPVEVPVYVPFSRVSSPTDEVTTMTALTSWALSVLGILGLVLVLHHLGVDATATIGSLLRGTEHFLGQPLLTF